MKRTEEDPSKPKSETTFTKWVFFSCIFNMRNAREYYLKGPAVTESDIKKKEK